MLLKAPVRIRGTISSPFAFTAAWCLAMGLALLASGSTAHAWMSGFVPVSQDTSVGSTQIGSWFGTEDGYDGQWQGLFDWPGLYVALYRNSGPAWSGPTGFYTEDGESPIPWGASKTWWGFCLWAQNYTPPGHTVTVLNDYEPNAGLDPPHGYIGQIVIDQVPEGVNWTGPMEYWFDMTVRGNTFLMPIATVTDPLQGTRFHLTVYTPEPCSLLALCAGIGAMGAVMRKRRG